MTNKIATLALIVALAALAVVVLRPAGNAGDQSAKKETAFERVMRMHTLRCGYAVWNPVLYKDMKTGEIRGSAHDIMEAVGKKLDLHIDWAEETGWGTLVEGLATSRYDAICVALVRASGRAKVIDFSVPVFYSPSFIVVRNDETRFSQNSDLDSSASSFAVLEGEASSFIVPKKFPKAQIKPLPQNADYSLVFQEVETRKAAATVVDFSAFVEYEKTNPGKLRILDRNNPVQLYAIAFGLPQGDVAMKGMIDAALNELLADGTIGQAVEASSSESGEFVMPAKPYAGADKP